METLEELLRKNDPNGRLVRGTARKMAVVLSELHRQGGKIEDKSGYAVRALYEPIGDQIGSGMQSFGHSFLNKMVKVGLIRVERKAKKTMSIEVIGYPPDVEKWLPEEMKQSEVKEPEQMTEAEASTALDGETQYVGPSEDEVEVLGGRPGRLAARIEKSVPEIVQIAVSDAFDNKLAQLFGALGFTQNDDNGQDERVAELADTNSRLVTALNQAVEDLRVEKLQHEYSRMELNATLEKDSGGLVAGTLLPSQVHRNLRDVAAWAIDNGWAIYRTNSGHLCWMYKPTKEKIHGASTPSDGRGPKNLLADLKRIVRLHEEAQKG